MTWYPFTALSACAVTALMAVFVYLKGKNDRLHVIFSFFSFSISICCLGTFGVNTVTGVERALFWNRIAYLGAIPVPPLFIHLIYALLSRKNKFLILKIFYAIALLFIYLTFTPFFIKGMMPAPVVNYALIPHFGYFLFAFLFFVAAIYGFIILANGYKKSTGTKRVQLKYFLFALLTAFVGGIFFFLLNTISFFPIPPLDNIFLIFFIVVLCYAIVRHRLMDIKIVITYTGILFGLYFFVLVLPFYVGYQTKSWVISTIFMGVLATIGPFVYRALQKRVDDVLLEQQHRYQQILMQSAKEMSQERNLDKLLKNMVVTLRRAIHMHFSAVFLFNEEQRIFEVMGVSGRYRGDTVFDIKHVFIEYLMFQQRPMYLQEMPLPVQEKCSPAQEVALIVPIVSNQKLIAFIVLGEKQNNDFYSGDDITLFSILSRQSALAIENCRFLDEFQQAKDRVYAAEKLASIGGMSEGVAHQVKNRLNYFAMAAAEIRMEMDEFIKHSNQDVRQQTHVQTLVDFLAQTSDTITANVRTTDEMIRGILNFARVEEKETFFCEYSFNEVMRLTTEPLKAKHHMREALPIIFEVDQPDTIFCVPSQIVEAMYNLCDNAYEAALEKKLALYEAGKTDFAPRIDVRLRQTEAESIIEVEDNGTGIKPENHGKMFAPFFSTKSSYKKSGTGIGMYVVKRMIEENHNGKVIFESRYGEGTLFRLIIPRKK